MPDLQKFVRYVLGAAFCCYAYFALLYVSYWAHQSHLIIAVIAVGMVAAALLLPKWLQRFDFSVDVDARQSTQLLWSIIAAGITIRILWIAINPPVLESDFLDYWNAAVRLIEEGKYYYHYKGHVLLAWRPPGYPLLLALCMRIFGEAHWLPLAINLVCFVVTCVVVRSLTEMLIGHRIASLFATGLMAAWPSAIAGAGYPASEWLSLALLTVCFWAIIKAQSGLWGYAILAGLCMGYGVLIRPGFIFLPFCWFIYFALGRPFDRRSLTINFVAMILAVAVVTPWSVRNLQVLDAFIPVSSNGGDVFYRSNNPIATGTYAEKGEKDLDPLMGDEVAWNRAGMAWGLEWIRNDPVGFLKLIPRKQAFYAGQDTTMIYWAMERAYNNTGPLYIVLRLLSNWYWAGVLILIAVAAIRARHWLFDNPTAGLLVATLLYAVAIHSVFESQSRHHLPMIGLMAILAATAVWRPASLSIGTNRP